MAFVCQIAFQEVKHLDRESLLPDAGLLSLFFEGGVESWGFDPADRAAFDVRWCDPSVSLVRHSFPDGVDEWHRFGPVAVSGELIETLPDPYSRVIDLAGWPQKGFDAYADELLEPTSDEPQHQLLGWPDQIQGDMQLECQLVTNGIYMGSPDGWKDPRRAALESGASDWRLLLQLDSDEANGMAWGDVGMIYLWIREQDLRARAFDQSWLILQCS